MTQSAPPDWFSTSAPTDWLFSRCAFTVRSNHYLIVRKKIVEKLVKVVRSDKLQFRSIWEREKNSAQIWWSGLFPTHIGSRGPPPRFSTLIGREAKWVRLGARWLVGLEAHTALESIYKRGPFSTLASICAQTRASTRFFSTFFYHTKNSTTLTKITTQRDGLRVKKNRENG